MSIHYTQLEDRFIIENYADMTSTEIAKALNKERKNVENRIHTLKKKDLLSRKGSYVGSKEEVLLEAYGRRNKQIIAAIRGQISLNKYINLQIGKEREKVDVIFKTYNYFTIKHKNYIESFNYTDVLIGKIKVAKI